MPAIAPTHTAVYGIVWRRWDTWAVGRMGMVGESAGGYGDPRYGVGPIGEKFSRRSAPTGHKE